MVEHPDHCECRNYPGGLEAHEALRAHREACGVCVGNLQRERLCAAGRALHDRFGLILRPAWERTR